MLLEQVLHTRLDALKQQHLYRQRRIVTAAQGVVVVVNGRQLINFCSNDYLGLASHPELVVAFQQAGKKYGVGSGASQLITGHQQPHHQLEEDIAAFTGRDRALLFSTGYMANLGVVSALTSRHDEIFADRLNHASLLDAAQLSRARLQRFAHTRVDALAQQLAISTAENKLVISDGVFSMDGDKAPLTALTKLTTQHAAWLMIDDAHGLGVLGHHGGGLLEEAGASQQDVPILVGTFGKAFGTFGAFVAGSEVLIESLIQFARSYIYTTAMPAAIAEATRTSLHIIKTEPARRARLFARIQQFRDGLQVMGLPVSESLTPVQPLLVGTADKALTISEALLDKGFLITAIRPPTVPVDTSRLRITFSANHSEQQVEQLLAAIKDLKLQYLSQGMIA